MNLGLIQVGFGCTDDVVMHTLLELSTPYADIRDFDGNAIQGIQQLTASMLQRTQPEYRLQQHRITNNKQMKWVSEQLHLQLVLAGNEANEG